MCVNRADCRCLRFQAFSCLTHFPACVRPLHLYHFIVVVGGIVCGIEVSFRLNIDINCLLLRFCVAAANHLNDVSPVAVRHTRRPSWAPLGYPNLSTPLQLAAPSALVRGVKSLACPHLSWQRASTSVPKSAMTYEQIP